MQFYSNVLTPDIPKNILALAEFRLHMRSKDVEIISGWINNWPKQVLNGLPSDWRKEATLHFSRINVDRLTILVSSLPEKEFKYVRLFWSANSQRLSDRRFQRLASLYPRNKKFDYLDRLF